MSTAQAGTDGHARHRLDEHIHAPVRFSLVAALERVGYVVVKKGYVGKRPRTWLGLSAEGRRAYQGHLAALRAIASGTPLGW